MFCNPILGDIAFLQVLHLLHPPTSKVMPVIKLLGCARPRSASLPDLAYPTLDAHILTLFVISFPFLAIIISMQGLLFAVFVRYGGLFPYFPTHPRTCKVGVFVLQVQTLIIRGLPINRMEADRARKISSIGETSSESDVNPIKPSFNRS